MRLFKCKRGNRKINKIKKVKLNEIMTAINWVVEINFKYLENINKRKQKEKLIETICVI